MLGDKRGEKRLGLCKGCAEINKGVPRVVFGYHVQGLDFTELLES